MEYAQYQAMRMEWGGADMIVALMEDMAQAMAVEEMSPCHLVWQKCESVKGQERLLQERQVNSRQEQMGNVRLKLNPLKESVGKDEAKMCQTEGVGETALKYLEEQQEPRECLYSRVLDVNMSQEKYPRHSAQAVCRCEQSELSTTN